MSQVFISYSKRDRGHAETLARALEAQGWSVWWDQDIPAGRLFDDVIDEAIQAASCVVVLWSKQSVSSEWVRAEAQEGRDREILVPIRIEEVKLPLAFRRVQAADLIGWDGAEDAPAFQRLLADIKRHVAPNVDPRILRHEVHAYSIEGFVSKRLALIAGDLRDVKECDCWVDPLGTDMQMASIFDHSYSAVIRYYGARHNQAGDVIEDLIANELREALGGAMTVLPASVVLTSGGQLEGSHGVKLVAHVAVTVGKLGLGRVRIDNVNRYVRNVLNSVDEDERGTDVRSVLFPVIGAGTATDHMEIDTVRDQIREAIDYLKRKPNKPDKPEGRVDRVCFLARTDCDLDLCRKAISSIAGVTAA